MECVICGKIGMDRSDEFCSTECKVESQQKCKIVRMFYEGHPTKVIKRGLTLQEAKAWCRDPETNSSTCKSKKARAIFAKYGEWYDGYAKDE